MPTPYIANEIILELDLRGKSATDGVARTTVQVECWITDYQITKDTGGAESVSVTTLCPIGQYNLANKAGSSGYSLNLGYVNDWCSSGASGSEISLSWILEKYPNVKSVPFTLLDRAGCDTGIKITGTISQLPDPQFGGQAGQVSSVSGAVFPLLVRPTVAVAAAATRATGATAGSPGVWTGLVGFLTPTFGATTGTAQPPTPTPTTAWTTGQYILDANKTEGYWDGTSWISGQRAP